MGLRDRFVDGPSSVAGALRMRRWELLLSHFPAMAEMSVIDLGGSATTWMRGPVHPVHVHIVNIEPEEPPPCDWLTYEVADATNLSATQAYDLAFSNAVIEHVGGPGPRRRFAETIHDLAPAHWVQTPYRYFPIEPHYLLPFGQFMPLSVRAQIVQRWPLVHTRSHGETAAARWRDAMTAVLDIELVGRAEMRFLFPDSRIVTERVLGLPKALIAIRGA